MTNCINCGASLNGNRCEYCGTEYGHGCFVCDMSNENYTGTVRFDGKDYQVYLGHVEGHVICGGKTGRDITGKMHIEKPQIKRTFTLIEV